MNKIEGFIRRIIREEVERAIDSRRLLTEYARVGFMDNLEVIVHTDDPGMIPHVHIVDKATRGRDFDCCVRLDTNQYFKHGIYRDEFNSSGCKAFNKFMHSPYKDDRYQNFYEFAVSMWDANNSNVSVEIKKDADGKVIVPDYTKITPYK